MVDANRYCFANPSITKRRTERVRRFKGFAMTATTLGRLKKFFEA
jgi:hypothetical protein